MDDRTGEDLVTSEGVNEGSKDSATESGPAIPQAVFSDELTRGGRAQDADEQVLEDERRRGARAVMASPWSHRDPNTPSLEQSVEERGSGR